MKCRYEIKVNGKLKYTFFNEGDFNIKMNQLRRGSHNTNPLMKISTKKIML